MMQFDFDRLYRAAWFVVFGTILVSSCAAVPAQSGCDVLYTKGATIDGFNLKGPFSVEDVESREMVVEGEYSGVPFGRINKAWVEFKSKLDSKSYLCHFKSHRESWAGLHGREGYFLVKKSVVIDAIITKQN